MAEASTALDLLASRRREREREALAGYEDLVKLIAGGEVPGDDYLESLIVDAGRTFAELQGDVRRLLLRRELRERLDSVPHLTAQVRDQEHGIALADNLLAAARLTHRETVGPLLVRKEELTAALGAASAARQELHATAPSHLREALARAGEKALELSKQAAERRSLGRRPAGQVDDLKSQLGGRAAAPERRELEQLEGRQQRFEAEAERLLDQAAAAREEAARLEAEILEP